MVSVTFENVRKCFGNTEAVRGVSIEVAEGELFFLLGPSGCGKTTCLRMAAGFEKPDSGRILFGGRDMSAVPPHRRNAGMVFQSYALFPHMSVERNVAFGLRFRNLADSEKRLRIEEAMRHTRISEFARRMPSQLSGGQQQRVALARALVIRPDVLLLDEPLSNLDAALRAEMRDEIRRIHSELGITAVYVTHDQEDALSMARRIALMRDGSLVQVGAPDEIYFHPRNAFAASFMGKTNLLSGKVLESAAGKILIDTPAGNLSAPAGNITARAGETVTVSLRPECISIHAAGTTPAPAPGAHLIDAEILSATFLGSATRIEARTVAGRQPIAATIQGRPPEIAPGARVTLSFSDKDVAVLEEE